MSVLVAVQAYLNVKADFDQKEAEASGIRSNSIPSVKAQIQQAELDIQIARKALGEAVTAENVASARADLISAEQNLNNLAQLNDNFESKLRGWEISRPQLFSKVENALYEIWKQYRDELFEQFELPEEVLNKLETLAAVQAGTSSNGGRSILPPITRKYHEAISHDQAEQIRQSILDGLIAQLD